MKLIIQKHVARHRLTIIQFLKFGTVGGVCFFLDYGLFTFAFRVLHFGHYGSAFFSFPFGATFTWIGNRLFTFRGKHLGSKRAQWSRFVMVTLVGFVINRGTYSLLTATVPLVYHYEILGLIAGTGAGMFFNFFVARKLVFKFET